MNKNKIYFRWCLVLLWMIVIFMFSMQNGSESSMSSGKVIKVLSIIFNVDLFNSPFINTISFVVRKCAHMFSYFVLAILSYRALILVREERIWFDTSLLCVGYAIFDEIHQLFVPGRAGMFQDVLIDSLGMLIAFLSIYLFNKCKIYLGKK